VIDSLPPRGWYPDPADSARERYWDGRSWTQHIRHRVEVIATHPTHRGYPDLTQTPHLPVAAALPLPAVSGPEAAASSSRVSLAGWWPRVGAAIIDYLIQTILLAIVLTVAARDFTARLTAAYTAWFRDLMANPTLTAAVPGPLLDLVNQLTYMMMGTVALYCVVFLGTWGATPGQRLLRLRIIPAPPAAELDLGADKSIPGRFAAAKLGWPQAIGRGLVWALLSASGQLLIFQVFSVLMVLWHPRRQTLPDLVARTLMVRQPRSSG
jgi:uncharacterized RDD family membrane protein YckC